MAKEATHLIETMHAAQAPHNSLAHYDDWVHGLLTIGHKPTAGDLTLKESQAAIVDVQQRLGHLAGFDSESATASRPAAVK